MKALLIVDLQNDFMPQGALGVPKADELVPIINALIPTFSLVVSSQDWHPPHHMSFAASHQGRRVGEVVEGQMLWPVHCVQETLGAQLVEGLDLAHIARCFYKGADPQIESYSAFFDTQHHSTGLSEFLKEKGVTHLFLVGVATDYCVLYTALDARREGLEVTVIAQGCRAIGDEAQTLSRLRSHGVHVC